LIGGKHPLPVRGQAGNGLVEGGQTLDRQSAKFIIAANRDDRPRFHISAPFVERVAPCREIHRLERRRGALISAGFAHRCGTGCRYPQRARTSAILQRDDRESGKGEPNPHGAKVNKMALSKEQKPAE
jgi:hypothetical protein